MTQTPVTLTVPAQRERGQDPGSGGKEEVAQEEEVGLVAQMGPTSLGP